MTRVLAAALAALALGGCIRLLPESEPVDTYRLTIPVSGEPVLREIGAPTVMIALPSATRAYGGDNIVIARGDSSLALAAGSRWVAPARNMLQDAIIQTFERAEGPAPLRPNDGIASDYDLSLDLRAFEAEYDQGDAGAPLIRVAIGARMISRARDLAGSSLFAAESRARSNTMTDIVAAFSEATAEMAADLVAWSAIAIDEAEAREAAEEAAERGDAPDVRVDVDVTE